MLKDLPPGEFRTAGPYHALGVLGTGGFATVYAAHNHEHLAEGLCAVKVPAESMSDRRFKAEIEAAQKLQGGYFPMFKGHWQDFSRGYAAELIRGLSITDLVKAPMLVPRDRDLANRP